MLVGLFFKFYSLDEVFTQEALSCFPRYSLKSKINIYNFYSCFCDLRQIVLPLATQQEIYCSVLFGLITKL